MRGPHFQKRMAAELLSCGIYRVSFSDESLSEIREAITRESIRGLIAAGAISKKPIVGIARGRARAKAEQKHKGRQKGKGSRRGKRGARLPQKTAWAFRVRVQRAFLQELRDKKLVEPKVYRMLYLKSKGGYFRSKRHIKLYIDEQKLRKR
ncbi:50S ribosomal protein L19e [Candidatus Woesearchaeota archaeon]|nr:50S ribosomal protein L19e [Candidatus Woesearchaeota archaeon]